jgi:hypothetical protein
VGSERRSGVVAGYLHADELDLAVVRFRTLCATGLTFSLTIVTET